MGDTTIGYAVLQIIPSLKGVSEAIEKQLAGKVIPVTIEPKTDPAKVDKSIKDAVKKKPVEVPITPKVDQKQLDQELEATKTKILKGAKDWDSFNKANAEKWAKIRLEEANKARAAEAAAAKAAAEKQGKDLSEAITGAVKKSKPAEVQIEPKVDEEKLGSKLGAAIINGLQELNNNPAVKDIGDAIGGAIGGKIGQAIGDSPLGNAAENVAATFQLVTESLATIKQGDAAGGLSGIADALTKIGQTDAATQLHKVADEVQPVQEKFGLLKGNIEGSATGLLGLTSNSGRISGGLSAVAGAAGPLAAVFTALSIAMPGFQNALDRVLAGKGALQDYVNVLAPATNILREFFKAMNDVSGLPPAAAVPNLPNVPGTNTPRPGDHGTPTPTVGGIPIPGLLPATPGRAGGGQILGAGSGVSDSILVLASNGEYIVNADATRKNLSLLEVINSGKLPGFAGGGAVGPDVRAAGELAGTPYDQASRHDCSGMPARVIDRILGLPETGLMSTKNAADWLAARGFKQGLGARGQISVGWYDHGPNPNDGHMAMTLSDGRNAEAGGSVGVFTIGDGAAGASSPQFDQHMYLPTVYGEGPAGAAAAAPTAGGAAVTDAAPASSSAGGSSPGGGGGSISLPSSLSGFGSFAGSQLGQLGQLGGGLGDLGGALGDLGQLGSAAGSFIDGQVSSALDVFGVPSSPGWLQGISKFVGGISIGGSGGGGVTPASSMVSPEPSASTPGPAAVPDGAHGGRAGQQPGPGVTYNITARDTEDAFIQAQRQDRERAAAKLDRYGTVV